MRAPFLPDSRPSLERRPLINCLELQRSPQEHSHSDGGDFQLASVISGCGGPGGLENPHFRSGEIKVSQDHPEQSIVRVRDDARLV